MRRNTLKLAARSLERRLNTDTSDDSGPIKPCPCGQTARFVDRRSKSFETVLGQLTLERAYYHCVACGHGFCPRDRVLGVEEASLSPAVVRMVGAAAALVSFQESSDLLRELAAVRVSAKQVERCAEDLGREIAEDERQHAECADAPDCSTMYAALDGTGIPMRASELVNRPGKQEDGSAKTREVKLCTVFTAESRNEHGHAVRDKGSVSYSAAIETAACQETDENLSEFAQRVQRETNRRGFIEAKRQVVVGDGAHWIWNIADELFPEAIQILDIFHAKQHLSEVASAIFTGQETLASSWGHLRRHQLDTGEIDDILAELAVHASECDEARKCAEYIKKNRHRMRYPEFRKLGLCVSSAVVEAGCKVAIGTRLKRAGMHWSMPGANAIIALRCNRLSGRFEDFWARRSRLRLAG